MDPAIEGCAGGGAAIAGWDAAGGTVPAPAFPGAVVAVPPSAGLAPVMGCSSHAPAAAASSDAVQITSSRARSRIVMPGLYERLRSLTRIDSHESTLAR
jgi:hypothetical protein